MNESNSGAHLAQSNELSAFQRCIGIFHAPRETIESIDRKPDWLAPMIILVLVSLIFTMFTLPISMPDQMEKQREKLEQENMSEEEIETAMAMSEKIGKIIAPIGAVVGTTLMILLMAAIYLFIGNIILGGQTTFRKMFSVYTYTSLIGVLAMAVKLPLALSKNSMDVNFSLATLMPADATEDFFFYVLKSIEIFTIWHFALMAIAFSVLYNFTMKKSGWIMGILFCVYVLISATLMNIFS